MICNTTPFYAEKGGQIYDIGSFQTVNAHGKVINVQINHKNQVLHRVEVVGKLKISDLVTLNIDVPRRHLVCNNHSATHLLHSALRHEISPEIHQTGSFNNDQYFRLDFNSPRKLLSEDLIVLENKVNQLILQKIKPEII
ncbi:MAG: alanine--tRNA ligase-related protein [Mollicutes bacterium]|nr:MAG: alanine--tRNA ligase-related protein [Mollicutes bacterium]